ncbi:nucleotidyltransferase family protein [Streptomyces violaceusniger]|uniref:Nucleotidyl transferase n=1 Tax=Streptomyces violaceusniger (strain Tu 4113) TaxID=653045 RepID=G2PHE7_STRV4|nr:nucleotidyltransferase family protein [Streptomyces violaceusniger]AEM88793.1 Nucleotidyl transferase [Streptomyces violaceusniger Tu 4113]
MEPTITQAIILAGGRAERMRPYSDAMPKALMPVGGLPLITRQLTHLSQHGIEHVVIASGYQHRQISEFVGGGGYHGLNVRHAVDPYPLGTAGAVRYAHQALDDPSRPFLVLNGSVSTDLPLGPLFARHAEARASATMALVRYTSDRPVAMESEDGRIQALPKVQLLPYWTDSGLTVLKPYTVKMLPEVGEITDVYETVAAEGLLAAHHAPEQVFWRELATVGDIYTYPDSFGG